MAARTTKSASIRSLVILAVLIAAIYGAIAIGVATKQSGAAWTPKLALDLEGGTQIILSPQLEGGKAPTQDEMNQAVAVMRQRVDASGVAEAEISIQGGSNIVVALPGHPSQATLDLVRTSAIMNFRPVLGTLAPTKVAATESPAPSGSPSAQASAPASSDQEAEPASPSASAKPQASTQASAKASASPSAAANPDAASPAATANPSASASPDTAPATKPTDPTSQDWITEALMQQANDLDCTDPKNRTGGPQDDQHRDIAIVACDQSGQIKYLLGPVAVEGKNLTSATPSFKMVGQTVSNIPIVNLKFNTKGAEEFGDITTTLAAFNAGKSETEEADTRSQFAVLLDSLVITAPSVRNAITNGEAFIEGSFTQESATTLANQLNFGSLPLSFQTQSEDQISATLGDEQLRHGLLAGLIGLILVAIYSLFQYRALGSVTIASLIIAAIMAYGTITLLSWWMGYRLSLPGVAGLIVAIGITADSFIVYFERIKDQVRDGRPYSQAVDSGWRKARRTILASDTVNFIAAIVLYLLAVGGVRGFAFTLGLTTILDLIIVFLFTHPVVSLLGHTRFFSEGHTLSGVNPKRLGAPERVRYQGRGRFGTSTATNGERELSIAERKAGTTVNGASAKDTALDEKSTSGKDEN